MLEKFRRMRATLAEHLSGDELLPAPDWLTGASPAEMTTDEGDSQGT